MFGCPQFDFLVVVAIFLGIASFKGQSWAVGKGGCHVLQTLNMIFVHKIYNKRLEALFFGQFAIPSLEPRITGSVVNFYGPEALDHCTMVPPNLNSVS